jgi:hypothetical protein
MPSAMSCFTEGARVITESSICLSLFMRVESLLLASGALLSPHPMVSSDTASAARSVAHIRLANAFMQFSRLFGSIVFCFSFQE